MMTGINVTRVLRVMIVMTASTINNGRGMVDFLRGACPAFLIYVKILLKIVPIYIEGGAVNMTTAREDQETAICITPCDAKAYISTNVPKTIRMLRKLCNENPDETIRLVDDPDFGVEVSFPKSWIRITPRKTMKLSDEERKRRSERMKKIRNGATQ